MKARTSCWVPVCDDIELSTSIHIARVLRHGGANEGWRPHSFWVSRNYGLVISFRISAPFGLTAADPDIRAGKVVCEPVGQLTCLCKPRGLLFQNNRFQIDERAKVESLVVKLWELWGKLCQGFLSTNEAPPSDRALGPMRHIR